MKNIPLKCVHVPLQLTLSNNHVYNFNATVTPGTCSINGFEVSTAELLYALNDLKKAIGEVLS